VFDDRVLIIFGPKSEEGRKKINLHNLELYNMYLLPNIIRVITSRRMGWAGM
jgi:hypothetical protein